MHRMKEGEIQNVIDGRFVGLSRVGRCPQNTCFEIYIIKDCFYSLPHILFNEPRPQFTL